MIFHFTLV